jgi:ketosteroid isomerase-like protein
VPVVGAAAETWRTCESCTLRRRLSLRHDAAVPGTGARPEKAGEAPGWLTPLGATAVYQQGVEGHWQIEEIFSTGDRVVVRWTGSGTHVAEVNGIPPTGKPIRVDAISVHRMVDGKIAETWEVWDTLGFLQQIGVVPQG